MRILKVLAGGLFVIALPVLFGTLSLRWLVADEGWYQAGFQKYGGSQRTRIAPEDLARSSEQISSYLVLERDRVDDISVRVDGQTQLLFKDRENRHMEDVRDLMGGFYRLGMLAGGYLLVYLLAGRYLYPTGFRRELGQKLCWAGGLTLGLFGGFGVLSLFSFDELFLQFHLVSFDNDLWILDPTKDNLLMMFPQGFWYDSAIRLAMATGAQAGAALLAGILIVRQTGTALTTKTQSR